MAPPSVVIRENVWPFIEKIALAARKMEHFTNVNFQEILGNGQRAPKIQTPMPPVGQHAPAQSAVRHVINATKVTEHLRRRDPFFRLLGGVGTVESLVPTFCLDHADPVLEALPSG